MSAVGPKPTLPVGASTSASDPKLTSRPALRTPADESKAEVEDFLMVLFQSGTERGAPIGDEQALVELIRRRAALGRFGIDFARRVAM